jgi:hypothetical protein
MIVSGFLLEAIREGFKPFMLSEIFLQHFSIALLFGYGWLLFLKEEISGQQYLPTDIYFL